MPLFVNECFPMLCTLSGATDCLSVFVFALMGQNFVSVSRIHTFQSRHTYTLGLGDRYNILNTNLIWFFRCNLFFYFFGYCLNRCPMYQFKTWCIGNSELQMCSAKRNITLACFRLSYIYQHDYNIHCGSLVISELEIF